MAFQYGRVAEIADGRGIGAALGKATVAVYAQGEADGNILLGAGLYIFFLGSQQNIKQVLTCPGPCDRRIMRLFGRGN